MFRRRPRGGQPRIRASLFITCLIDQLYPHVGEAVLKVLQGLGVEVSFPPEQTCCGQPAFNGGYRREAAEVAKRFLGQFKEGQYIVVPAGSCASMIKGYYEELFENDPDALEMVQRVRERTYEFSDFIVNVLGKTDVGASFSGRVLYHDSCHLLRELGISDQPRQLIAGVKGAELVELNESGVCCGFGGLFSVKYAGISEAILEKKLQDIEAAEADVLVANDSGCLMQMAGAMKRRGMRTYPMHLAELLASEGVK